MDGWMDRSSKRPFGLNGPLKKIFFLVGHDSLDGPDGPKPILTIRYALFRVIRFEMYI